MRPRVFPAEDLRRESLSDADACRFNEAAGIPRGRQSRIGSDFLAHDNRIASMRPRVFPAEDVMFDIMTGSHRAKHASMRPRVFPAEDVAPLHRDRVVANTPLQ